jgi:hypothetical protein
LGTAEPIEPGVIEDPAAGAPSSNCRRVRRVSGVGPCVFVMWLRWCLRNAYCVRPASLTVRHHKLEEQSDFAIPNPITTNGTASNSHCHHAYRVHRDGCLGLGQGHPRAGRRAKVGQVKRCNKSIAHLEGHRAQLQKRPSGACRWSGMAARNKSGRDAVPRGVSSHPARSLQASCSALAAPLTTCQVGFRFKTPRLLASTYKC